MSRASVHTYWGGKQEIATTHTDGSKGLFQTNGECQSTNNPMDIEVAQYMSYATQAYHSHNPL